MTPPTGNSLPVDRVQRNSRTPFQTTADRLGAGRFGLMLFLISLGALFAATLVAFLVLRFQAGELWPATLPAVPWMLWISTAVLIIGSGTVHFAVVMYRRDQVRGAMALIGMTGLLGVLFVLIQAAAWFQWHDAVASLWNQNGVPRVAAAGFYMLTGIHAVHVIGGLVAVGVVLLMAAKAGAHHVSRGVIQGCAMYWHFLDVVWIILLLVMVFAI
ncbi:MAG: heme-copper oxidase subunit III [Phycisphaerales bacterium]|nr:heme-copper oxidase subunit III [Phycisphaerales bacterium]